MKTSNVRVEEVTLRGGSAKKSIERGGITTYNPFFGLPGQGYKVVCHLGSGVSKPILLPRIAGFCAEILEVYVFVC